jgi:hypothetical protein
VKQQLLENQLKLYKSLKLKLQTKITDTFMLLQLSIWHKFNFKWGVDAVQEWETTTQTTQAECLQNFITFIETTQENV